MLVLEFLGMGAGDDDGDVAIDCNVLLRFGPWGLDGYKDVVSSEHFARFGVDLAACSEEAEVEFVFLVIVPKVVLVVYGTEDFVVDGIADLAWDAEE